MITFILVYLLFGFVLFFVGVQTGHVTQQEAWGWELFFVVLWPIPVAIGLSRKVADRQDSPP